MDLPALPSLGLLGRYVAVLDADQRWVALTEDLAALLGYRVHDLIGVCSWEVAVEKTDERRAAFTEPLFSNGVLHGSSALRTRRSGIVPVLFTARTLNGGSFYAIHVEVAASLASEVAASAERTLARSRADVSYLGSGSSGWLTKEEAARYTRYSSSKLDRAVASGFLRAGGGSGRRLYQRGDLDDWLAGGAQG